MNILQSLSEATSIKIKDLQRNLTLERAKLFSDLDTIDAHNIWNATKCKIRHFNQHLAFTERRKYLKTIELKPNFTNIDPLPIRKKRTRRFRRNRSTKSRVTSIDNVADVNLTAQTTCPSIPDYSPINLSSTSVSDAEVKLLSKGPSFCPTPKDINWLKTTQDLDNFERRIRLAAYFHDKNAQEVEDVVTPLVFPTIPSNSTWMPPKSSIPEVEVFLKNLRADILNPENTRAPKDNLSREERKAIHKLKEDDRVIRIQDKGSRFVIMDKNDYQTKMEQQLTNPLHYNIMTEDPSNKFHQEVTHWAYKWLRRQQISEEIFNWITEVVPKLGVA
ncbi:hypothetical protein HOLleu_35323 [Holothuria leucospilota]|uniref:Uncharacterized protein n=1 Tax=Holothuria leucospilota TaxID=206669 RepID=A0A9Q1BHA5_HOLLE|nr:hypothetical protein HOLleu_35323 [Holothuria leucospilota]